MERRPRTRRGVTGSEEIAGGTADGLCGFVPDSLPYGVHGKQEYHNVIFLC